MRSKIFFYIFTLILFSVILAAPTYAQQIVKSQPFCTKVGNADDKKNPCTQAAGNLTFYCQWNTAWGSHPIGPKSCDTVAAAGCGPTSLAMLLSAYGGNLTPPQVADIITNEQEFVCGDQGGTAMQAILTGQEPKDIDTRNQLGIEAASQPLASGNSFRFDLAEQFLSDGYLIIGSSGHFLGCGGPKGCGHIFVVQSVNSNTGEVTLRDPNNCNQINFQENPTKMVYKANHISTDGSGWLYAYAVRKKQ